MKPYPKYDPEIGLVRGPGFGIGAAFLFNLFARRLGFDVSATPEELAGVGAVVGYAYDLLVYQIKVMRSGRQQKEAA